MSWTSDIGSIYSYAFTQMFYPSSSSCKTIHNIQRDVYIYKSKFHISIRAP